MGGSKSIAIAVDNDNSEVDVFLGRYFSNNRGDNEVEEEDKEEEQDKDDKEEEDVVI